MKFVVEIPDDVVKWANCEAVNRQMIAKFMREELMLVGTRHGHSPELGRGKYPGEDHNWRAWIFNLVRVRATTSASTPKPKKSRADRLAKLLKNGST